MLVVLIDRSRMHILWHLVPGVLVEKILTEEDICLNQIRYLQERLFLNGAAFF